MNHVHFEQTARVHTVQNFKNRNYLIDCCSSDNWLSKIVCSIYFHQFCSTTRCAFHFCVSYSQNSHTHTLILELLHLVRIKNIWHTQYKHTYMYMLSNIPIKISKILLIYFHMLTVLLLLFFCSIVRLLLGWLDGSISFTLIHYYTKKMQHSSALKHT